MKLEDPCNIGRSLTAGNHGDDRVALLLGELGWTSHALAANSCMRETGLGAISDHLSFELREGSKHRKQHFSRRKCRIDVFREAAKSGSGLLHALQNGQQVLQRSGEAIQLPHDHDVTRSKLIKHAMELRAIPTAARCSFLEDPSNPGRLQRANLRRAVLIVGRHAGIAEQNVAILHRKKAKLCERILQPPSTWNSMHRINVANSNVFATSNERRAAVFAERDHLLSDVVKKGRSYVKTS